MEQEQLISLLRGAEAFAAAPEEALAQLVASGEIRSIAKDEVLLHQGSTGESIWLILEGELDIIVDEKVVNHLNRSGEVLGEISAISQTPATATVTSRSQGSALCIPHQALHQVIRDEPEFAATMLRSMAKYLGS
ncbi:MAG: cyclic nucleotide-binding domain-containing protein [Verrucomicrobiales bacterium]|jgi:CRP-like cAMP-binding protein|nr:cyclic nucleotide-binding domain-containing protein [Verrucomicrobiales bacterium]